MIEYVKIWNVNDALERDEMFRRAAILDLNEYSLKDAVEYLIAQDLINLTNDGWALTEKGKEERRRYPELNFEECEKSSEGNSFELEDSSDCGPWDGFRKILRYYIDCVKFDERPNCNLNTETLNRKYIFPLLPYNWLETAAPSVIPVKLPKEAAPLLRSITTAREEQGLFIGYPLHLFKTNYGTLISPVCAIPCNADIALGPDNTLKLAPLYDQADFNSQWIDKGIGQDQRNAILMGAITSTSEDEELAIFDIRKALGAVQSLLGDKLCSPLDPQRLAPFIDMNSAEPGIHNTAVLFIGEKLKYSLSLLKELKKILHTPDAELDNTSLGYIFRNPVLQPEVDEDRVFPLPFIPTNQQQELAVELGLNSSCLQITGPPGTGKSQATANLIANIVYNNRTVLFSSRNHKAIQAVTARCQEMAGEIPFLRSSSSQDNNGFSWRDAVKNINEIIQSPHSAIDSDNLKVEISELTEKLQRLKQYSIDRQMLTGKLGELNSKWERITGLWSEQKIEIILSANALPKEKDVIELEKIIIPSVSFANNNLFLKLKILFWKLFKRKKAQVLINIFHVKAPMLWDLLPGHATPLEFSQYVENSIQEWREYKAVFDLKSEITKYEQKSNFLAPIEQINEQFKSIHEELPDKSKKSLELILRKRFINLPDDLKAELQNLLPVLKQLDSPMLGDMSKMNWERFLNKTVKKLLSYYPAWAGTLLSLKRTLPLVPGIVDYTIIDEASQCELPPVIPALFRARRFIIVGDPKQFRPVITLSPKRHEYLKFHVHSIKEIGLQRFDYIVSNAFDLGNGFQSLLLRNHFRCHDVIADYFNKMFYGGNLNVLTDKSKLKLPKAFKPGIEWFDEVGPITPTVQGPVVEVEISRIHNILLELKDQGYKGTVGVISPFKAQARALEERLLAEFNDQPWNFTANTAHSFQGDERDVIIFSPAFQEGLHKRYKWLICENSNLTNVAISRARALLIIVGNRGLCKLSGVPFLQRLSNYPDEYVKNFQNGKPESIWEERLWDALKAYGIPVVPQYPVAGRRLDFAVPDLKLAIEVDGEKWHRDETGHRKADDLWRDYTLSLLGWKTIRFWVYELRDNMPQCLDKIKSKIETLHNKSKQ